MSRDITDIMRHYQESARTSWSSFFKPLTFSSDKPEEGLERFIEVERSLFKSLVLWELEQCRFEEYFGKNPIPFLRVLPRPELLRCNVMISRNRDDSPHGAWYWDDPVTFFEDEKPDLRFIDYFDWDAENFRDYQYIRTRVTSFQSHPHLVGRDALLEPLSVLIYYEDVAPRHP